MHKLSILFLIYLSSVNAVKQRPPYDDGVCGRPKFAPTANTTGLRITGGEEAVPHSQPWMVYIEYRDHRCGGVIAPTTAVNSSDVVITAKLCLKEAIYENDLNNVVILAGVHNLVDTGEVGRRKAEVEKIEVEDEMALIKLRAPLQFDDYVKSACLPQVAYLEPRTKCLASGFGAIEGGVAFMQSPFHVPPVKTSNVLMTSMLIAHSEDFCARIEVMGGHFKPSKHVCAGDIFGKKGINSYDAGGPLVCLYHDVYTLYGLSKARAFVHETKPSMFIKVGSYNHFIREKTGIKLY